MSAKAMLALCFIVGIGFDVAAGAAIWFEKPWWMIVAFLLLGAFSHPGAQPTIRKMAEDEAHAQ